MIEPNKVLKAMRVEIKGNPEANVFQLGCVSNPLNFASQQMRAFALTWALDRSGLIRNQQIGIVGGGLAGITAGTVCLLRGAKEVALYDRNHQLMGFQQGAIHRYIHPFIWKWPKENAEQESTEFPILNWNQDNADKICTRIIQEANRLLNECYQVRGADRNSPDYKHRLGCNVRQICPFANKIRVLAEGQECKWNRQRKEYVPTGFIKNYQEKYDVVIVAVGFGLELESSNVPFRSYWHLETLSQPTIRGNWPKRWLVSGTGDGGLIDAVRLRLFNADQEILTKILTGESEPIQNILEQAQANENLLTREQINADYWKNKINQLRRTLEEVDKKIKKNSSDLKLTENQIGLKIQDQYQSIRDNPDYEVVFSILKEFLKSCERTDTIVYLNGTQETPYSLNAGALQRFLIYLLRLYCGLRYRSGRLDGVDLLSPKGPYRITFKKRQAADETLEAKNLRLPLELLEVDEVVIRHGSESAFSALFGSEAEKLLRENKRLRKLNKKLQTLNMTSIDSEWCEALTNPIPPHDLEPVTTA